MRNLTFGSANVARYNSQQLFKLSKVEYDPVSAVGSDKKSTRFNFKDTQLFKNRVIYFGQDAECCYAELFHADFMTQCYQEYERQPRKGELSRAKFKLYEYQISLDNLLVVTSNSTFKALGIPERVLKDEWFHLNFEYDIPSSSQILGAIARAQGYKGILYTSVRHQTKNNLVLFEENLGEIDMTVKKINETDFDLERHEKTIGLRQ